jgi:putative transposase
MQFTDDAAYHVLSRGHNRETIFADADDCRYFLALLARYRQRFGLRLYHYCLMPTHWHLVLWPAAEGQMTSFLRWWTLTYSVRGRAEEFKGPFARRWITG